MDDTYPLVTVNIVTRNRAQELCRAIESVWAQTYRPIEIVVVDNDSNDGSADIIEQRWPEIRVIRLHRNVGCEPGRNMGMKNSRGQFIFNLDDDGALEAHAIERVVARFQAEPDVAVVAGAVLPMSEDRASLVKHKFRPWPRYVGGFPGGASAIRQSVLEETGYLPEYFREHAEADLALRILDKGYEMVYLPDVIMYHAVSDVERSNNAITHYRVWHVLETALRLEPWSRCIPNIAWKIGFELIAAVRRGTFRGYVTGVCRFVREVPRTFRERRPVRKWTIQKSNFLTYNYIRDGAQARNFQRFSFWQMARRKLSRGRGEPASDGGGTEVGARETPGSG